MNKKLGLAVAGALLALSSTANAGITIPAGDWTVDIGGNVNAYYSNTRFSGDMESNAKNAPSNKSANTVSTGLLPAALGIGAKTRQNDLDIAFQFTLFTGVDSNSESPVGSGSGFYGTGLGANNGAGGNSLNIRQAYLTFGDASWGQVKMGRDLGVFGSDAILSDMTLLGVGIGAGGNGSSTLGRIGSGYLYADWVGQVQYQSPNWNGFQFTAAARQPWANSANHDLGFDAKAVYSWAGDVSGKVWVGGLTQKTRTADAALVPNAPGVLGSAATTANDNRATAMEIGANVSVEKANFVAYVYDAKNMGLNTYVRANTVASGLGIWDNVTDSEQKGGYAQATYVIPTGTKLGASYGISKNDARGTSKEFESKSWIVGAYHPLTKSLNLVAEYTSNKLENIGGADNVDGKAKTVSLGAILFF
jgi:predicted porin